MLKYIIGSVYSGNANGLLDPRCVDILYGRLEWPKAWGMYWMFWSRVRAAAALGLPLLGSNMDPKAMQ